MSKLTKEQAIDKLWRAGNLSYKLKGIQKEMYDTVHNTEGKKGKKSIFLVSRRSGKSFTMALLATEYCTKYPNSIIKYLLPKKKDAKTILLPIMRTILEDCPEDLKPEWKVADYVFDFPNGSQIQLGGTDNGNAESLRGGFANIAMIDEAGFQDYNDFTYIVQSIIVPTLLTTRGRIVMASTPSKEPSHPFMVEYVEPAREAGELIEYDIYSNPMIDEQQMQEIIEEYPLGIHDPNFRREMLLESSPDQQVQVVPEFDSKAFEDIVRVSATPDRFDTYVSGDVGAIDLTVYLFGYWDWDRQVLVIKDELVLGGDGTKLNTGEIADGIIRKEKELFKNKLTGDVDKPYMRIMDNNLIVINDLRSIYNLDFYPTKKDDKSAAIDQVRVMIQNREIEIDPKCEVLLHHLKTTQWRFNSIGQRKGFKRTGKVSKHKAHHGDAIDALVYLVRNIQRSKNPYPDNYGNMISSDTFTHPGHRQNNNKLQEFMHGIIGLKKKK